MMCDALLARGGFGPLGEEPRGRSRYRDVVAMPLPRIGRRTLEVAVEEAPQLGGSAKRRLLGGDYDEVEVGSAEAKHGPGVPARKSRAEAVQDLDQLSLASSALQAALGADVADGSWPTRRSAATR